MADIAVTKAQIALVHPTKSETWQVRLVEAATEGALLYQNVNGLFGLCDVSSTGFRDEPRGIALECGAAGQVVSMVRSGALYGYTLTGLNYDALVYASETAGVLNTTAVAEIAGRVIGLSDPDKTKVLFVDFPWHRANYN